MADQLITLGGCCSDRTLIINVQGDQPFLDPAVIEAMVAEFSRRSPTPEVLTPVFRMSGDVEPAQWHQHTAYWGHVGIFGYHADVLLRWNTLPHSPLERIENLSSCV